MANIKSAKKRIKVIQTKTERNKAIKSEVKTYIKKVEAAVAAKDAATANEVLAIATKKIDMAASKGIIHKNCAAHRKSAFTKALSSLKA